MWGAALAHCLELLLLLSWACYVMGWEGGVYSQEDGTQVLQQGDLVWVWGYHKVQNVSATGTYRGAAAGWDTLLVSSLYTNTSRVSTVNAVYTIACPTEHLLYQCSYLRAEPATTTRECDRQTDTQTHLSWLVPVEKSTERVRGNEPV